MLNLNQAVDELKNGSTLWCRTKQGILSMRGSQALDFLQRMSTNDLLKLSPTHPLSTSFINSKGRMIDHAMVFLQEDRIVLVSSHERAQILYDWLLKFQFIEDFTLDIDEDLDCYQVFGSALVPREDALSIGGRSLALEGVSCQSFLVLAKEPPRGLQIDHDAFETLRIAASMPLAPSEINDRWMPQNINLLSSIAADKGCFIGQEVILKALTYQKNVKLMVGRKLSHEQWTKGDVLEGELLSRAPVYRDGLINTLIMVTKSSNEG